MPAPHRGRAKSGCVVRRRFREPQRRQGGRFVGRAGRAADHEDARPHELHAHTRDPRRTAADGIGRGAAPAQRLGTDRARRSEQAGRGTGPSERTRLDRSRLHEDRYRRHRLADPAELRGAPATGPAGRADGGELRGRWLTRRTLLPQHRPVHAPSRLRPVPARRPQLLLARAPGSLHLADAGRNPFRPSLPGGGLLRPRSVGSRWPDEVRRPERREGREAGGDPVDLGCPGCSR